MFDEWWVSPAVMAGFVAMGLIVGTLINASLVRNDAKKELE